ncbi:MAG: sulfatase [Bacteroidales bacterium]|nr:sulfatase [Bacteroidales bacterium]
MTKDISATGSFISLGLLCTVFANGADQRNPTKAPNVLLINCDDLGWGEVSCYGSSWSTPNIDRLAANGVRFTSCYSGNAFSSPSRASLLTGSYAFRTGIREVLFPNHDIGLNPDEFTIAEMFHHKGYTTACVGKWHLGNKPEFMPLNHGFDYFYGIPYSHDMMPRPGNPKTSQYPPLPLIKGNDQIDTITDVGILTNMLTKYSVDFIRKNKDKSFFLYLPHPMPHTPLAVTKAFNGLSGYGLLGDVITELDWSVGELIKTLEECGILDHTVVIFTSDNGSPRDNHSPGPFRGGKGSSFEGGQRVPFIISWPGVIPKGMVNDEVVSHMDLLPTFSALLKSPLSENKIDGFDIWPLMICREGAKTPHESLFFFIEEELESARFGNYKYHIPHVYNCSYDPKYKKGVATVIEESLFDLNSDPKESENLIGKVNVETIDSFRRAFLLWRKAFYPERRPVGTLH